VLYAGGLFWTARRRPIPDAAAWTAIALDLGWVVGSVAVIEVGILSRIGAGLICWRSRARSASREAVRGD